jgi:nucleotide-binding universal stress UspA family protein
MSMTRSVDGVAGSIVVGVDGSVGSDRAIDWAAQQAEVEHRRLVLLHSADPVVLHDPGWLDTHAAENASLATALDHAAHVMLRRARTRVGSIAPDLDVTPLLTPPGARENLVEASRHAHLVVLGSHGRGAIGSTLLGSVSASVAKQALCPVVVCRPPARTPVGGHRVVVGADGTPASRPVLDFAFAQASLVGAPLTVMHCFWDVLVATRGAGVVTESDPEGSGLDDLRLLLSESAAGYAQTYPDVEVTLELGRGMVDECLAGRALGADLLVVGHAPLSGASRFFHTSCAIAVLERAHTSVAVVPEA